MAVVVLVLVYVGLSLLNDTRGYLGTDTGGKVATLRAIDHRGTLDPDVGYWAARWDPQGRLHPLYYTSHLHGKWVNVTTLPALYLAVPLFHLAGYRGALLLPMLGSALAALAARALASRLGADERGAWVAFCVVGLASPLVVYALDFWEHSIGVALVAWAVVLLVDIAGGRAGWRAGVGAGLLVGAAGTMRTESLAYGAVATVVACGWLLWRGRRLVPAVLAGLAVTAGLVLPLAANTVLERVTIGTTLRAQRAAGTVGLAVAGGGSSRLAEAALTGLGLQPALQTSSYLLGAALLALLVLAAVRATQGQPGQTTARLAAVGVGGLYLVRAIDGLGFVPGLVAATPLAAVGLAVGWRRDTNGAGAPASATAAGPTAATSRRAVDARRLVLAVALLALPVVWALQYTGGAAPQWAGRYILSSGLLLGVLGVVSLPALAPWARRAALLLATAVTAFGVSWLSVRSNSVARAGAELADRQEPVVVSDVAFLLREFGWYAQGRRWLTAPGPADQREAARVVGEAGYDRMAMVQLDEGARPPDLPGFAAVPGRADRVELLSGVWLRVTSYRRTG